MAKTLNPKIGGDKMPSRSHPSILPLVILLALFFGALIAVHANVESLIGREIADFSILILFFGIIALWANRV